MFRGKNYKESAKLIDKQAQYEPQEAFELITKTAKAKFDETVEPREECVFGAAERRARRTMPRPPAGKKKAAS